MRHPVEARFGYGVARLPLCTTPYPSRPAPLPLWAGLGYCVRELFQAHSGTSLRRAATSTGIFALFAMLAVATALTVVRLQPETGAVQIVAFQAPEPKPAQLLAPPEPPTPARKPKPAPLPPPPPERSVPEPEPPEKLELVPPRAPEAPRVRRAARSVARPEPRRSQPVPSRPDLRIVAPAALPGSPEPPRARPPRARPAAPSGPPAPDLAPLTRPAEFREVARASDRAPRLRPAAPSQAVAAPSFGLAAPPASERAAVAESSPRVTRARRPLARVDMIRPPVPQLRHGPGPLPSNPVEKSRAPVRAPRVTRPRDSSTSPRPGALAPPLPAAPALPSSPDPVVPRLPGRTTGSASARARRSDRASRLRGVPLGSLAACDSDRREDSLKQRVIAAVTRQEECVSEAGIYRFLETRNLNAFLLYVERAESRSVGDRCTELSLALECLNPSSR